MDLIDRIFEILGHFELTVERDFAGLSVDLGDDLVLLAILPARGGLNRLLHGDQHVVDVDALFLCHGFRDPDQFEPSDARGALNAKIGQRFNSFLLPRPPQEARRSARVSPS